MADALEFGRRPFIKSEAIHESGEGLTVCPGAKLQHDDRVRSDPSLIHELLDGWGPVLGVWEGYAVDAEIRFSGSSGGAASAIALYCLEREGMSGVLHTAAREDIPYLNQTVMSKNRADLLKRTGSRYSPASPCEGLELIESSLSQCVFIGKPCDIAGAQNARKMRPELNRKIGLTIAFFCAGVPSIKGTLDLMARSGVQDPKKVTALRYRGNGWPGKWTVDFTTEDGKEKIQQLTYAESWGFLQKYRQWRCYICPDHTGEFADIAVGDPWYREVQPGEPGKSLVVARTKRGLDILAAAQLAGYLTLETKNPDLLPRSQPNLLAGRGALWARLWVSKLFGAATPEYTGFPVFRYWIGNLALKAKLQSLVGTAKRVFVKRLNKRIKIKQWHPGSHP
jgi:coenzyme F420 hydrogenase subunit beta